jgi:hypothetical protein
LCIVAIDVDELTQVWTQAWEGFPPLGYSLRNQFPERWVRFHSLPGSHRYPDTEDDYRTILYRHNTLLRELGAATTYLITIASPDDDLSAQSQPVTAGLHPNAVKWMHVNDPDTEDGPTQVYVSRELYVPGCFDLLLMAVADDQAAGVIIADEDMRWLYHPYDGGADIIAGSPQLRHQLRTNHPDWLSTPLHGI